MESSALCPSVPAAGDLDLMRRVAEGDEGAVREMLGRHHEAMHRFARAALGRADGADDAVQAALLRAVGAAGRYDGRAPLRAWLLAIVWREVQRGRRRRAWLPLFEGGAGDRAAPSAGIAAVEGEAWIFAALAQLPPPMRAAFALVHVEGASVAEAALALNVPEGTVKSRVHGAKLRLRTILGDPDA